MITLDEIDAPIEAAKKWPAGIADYNWGIIRDEPSDDDSECIAQYRKNPSEVLC